MTLLMPPQPQRAQLPPPPPAFAVTRPRLMRRLRGATRGRLTLIVGPAGAGKSLLVRQWAASELGRSIAWANVDPLHVDGVSFAHELLVAFSEAWEDDALYEPTRRIEAGGERMGTSFLEALVGFSSGRPPTVLVVEDVHELPPVLMEEMVWLVERAPTELRFVFTSRNDLRGVHRLRSRGEVSELGPLDLALDRAESSELVERVSGLKVTPEEIDSLWTRTEGWAVGVQLAAVAVRDRPPGMTSAEAMKRIDKHVGDYIDAEVVERQPPELRGFLRLTAVLDRLSGPLCDDITGRSDGHEVLVELEKRTLIAPVDAKESWFRYHPLVSDALRRHLRATDSTLYHQTLKRASAWHLAQGDLEGAIEYLVTAQAWNDIMDLVSVYGWSAYEQGNGAAAIRWLRAVPAPLLRAHTQASLALVVIERFVGNSATVEALLNELELRHAEGTRERAGLDVVRATGVYWGYPPDKALARAEGAIALLDAHVPPTEVLPGQMPDSFVRSAALLAIGRSLVHLGRTQEAIARYKTALEDVEAYVPWRVLTYGGLARAELAAGRLGDAARSANESLEIARCIGAEDHVATAEATLAAGQVASERGDLETAEQLLDAAEVRARRNRRSNVVASIVAARTRVLLAKGDVEGARCELSRWKAANEPLPAPDVLHNLGALEAMTLIREGSIDDAKRMLTGLMRTPLTLGVAGQLALASGDTAALKGVLGAWPQETDVRGQVRHLVWQCIAAHQEGRVGDAARLLTSACGLAQGEGFVRIFLDAGPLAGQIIASLEVESPSPFLEEIQKRVRPSGKPEEPPDLLSAREMAVLRLLPTALSNTQIAAELYISTNTLKTHLRRVYRKLEASNRVTAVERARALGIL